MGLCASVDERTEQERRQFATDKNVNRALDRVQQKDAARDKIVKKLLLLGAGESGKSTLFKQMTAIYGPGFPPEERKNYVCVVSTNLIACMRALCDAVQHFGGGKAVECKDALAYVMELPDDDTSLVDAANVHHFKALWQDPAILVAYENRSKFQLPDSANYFFDRLDAIAEVNYLPTDQDILRTRVKTSGIVVSDFLVEGNEFKMIDVGGQRNERKKWIACFEGVTAVLFIGVLSEYDLVLIEDDQMNRMQETLTLFEEICNSPFFTKTAMILMLNKRDSFAEKIVRVPLGVCPLFKEHTGLTTYDAGVKLIQEAFLAKAKNKLIYTHITCATDTGNMKVVFEAVKDIVIRAALNDVGLLG
jgi:guanine nucleotide-binding protein subunit alpha